MPRGCFYIVSLLFINPGFADQRCSRLGGGDRVGRITDCFHHCYLCPLQLVGRPGSPWRQHWVLLYAPMWLRPFPQCIAVCNVSKTRRFVDGDARLGSSLEGKQCGLKYCTALNTFYFKWSSLESLVFNFMFSNYWEKTQQYLIPSLPPNPTKKPKKTITCEKSHGNWTRVLVF